VSATRTSAIAHTTDPGIVFPSIPRGATSVVIPADLLFNFDSAALSPAAQAYLSILAQQVRAQGRTILKVIGHTDAVGTQSYNLGLYQQRAQAVTGALALDGFAHVTAVGDGESNPACSPQYTQTGAPIASCMAKDRRVQIILGG
jgi:outer membrane protein OmpA-like peptidoglycan-associated protein